jgi:hypothetical protein
MKALVLAGLASLSLLPIVGSQAAEPTQAGPSAATPVAARTAGVPDFATDAAADRWLRNHSPAYRRMAEFVDERWGCAFGRTTESAGGLAYLQDGKGHIDLNDDLKGAHRVSVIIFEMTNLYQQDRHEEITSPVRRGQLRDATQFALLREAVEYDGLRLHREVLEDLAREAGGLPAAMITCVSSTATNLAGYALPYAYDYFKAQAASGHTDHYRRLFEQHAAEAGAEHPVRPARTTDRQETGKH